MRIRGVQRRRGGSLTRSGRGVSRLATALTMAIVLWPYAISFSDQEMNFTLINQTPYYLHVTINNDSHLYIGPGRVVTEPVSGYGTVIAEVTYSPGQVISGTATKTFQPVRHDVTTGTNTCTDSGSNCQSSTSSSSTIDPISWTVTPADMATH